MLLTRRSLEPGIILQTQSRRAAGLMHWFRDCSLFQSQVSSASGCTGSFRIATSTEPPATLDHLGDKVSPAYSAEPGLILLTFHAVRGCVLLLHL